jgi:phosphoribosyl 1,2-cyclic phosphodiesterase
MIRVRFWGTRGTITTPGRATLRYGGNTPCVQVIGFQGGEPGAAMRLHNPQLILDGGTGLVSLKTVLMGGPWGRGRGELHILLSHFHWDHLIGFPFFDPMFVKGNRVVFYGVSIEAVRSSVERLFTSIYSPLKGVQNVEADLAYRRMEPSGMEIAGFQVQTAENRHPGGSLTFRIQYGSHVVVYSTDHGVGEQEVDSRLVALAQGAHLWILDAQYTSEERSHRKGWGHSSPLEAVKLALEAGVETAVLFHHDPNHDDSILDQMALEAAESAASTQTKVLMARDGMVVDVGGAPVSG